MGVSGKIVHIVPSLLTWMILKQSTGAATLLIHMLANIATPMHVSSTVLGLVPALLKVKVAIIFAMLFRVSSAGLDWSLLLFEYMW